MERVLEHVRRRRWIYLGLVIAMSAFSFWAIKLQGWRITDPARDFIYAMGLANLLMLIWIYAVSGFRPAMRQSAIIFWAALQLVTMMSLRVDGFDGNAQPIMKWRWTPTVEQHFTGRKGDADGAIPAAGIQLGAATLDDSPGYRGAERTGKYTLDRFATDWKQNSPKQVWRQPVGIGWSSFAVVDAFCFTQEQRGDKETVVCYELATGNQIWAHEDACRFDEATSGSGPRATPTIRDGCVYTFGATGILNCLDGGTGQVVWSVDTKEQGDESLIFGESSSPLVIDGMVVVATRGNAGWLGAFDRTTGDRLWATRTDVGSHSSPQLVEFNDEATGGTKRMIVNFDNANLRGFALDGSELWNVPYGEANAQFVNVSQPVMVANDEGGNPDIVVSAGYGRGSSRFRLSNDEDEWKVDEVWHTSKLGPKFSSVIAHDGYLYGLHDGILTCVDLADGRRCWKRGRYGHGQMVMVNDALLIQCEDGDLALVAVDPDKHRELTRVSALSDRTWNVPVVSGQYLLIRNDREAVCYELPID